jgi:hypothetical protein
MAESLGGTKQDEDYSVDETQDHGYIITGPTSSTDGEVVNNHAGGEAWIVKLDAGGTLLRHKTFGGTNGDLAWTAMPTNDGDVSGNHGAGDAWVMKFKGPLK